MWVRRPVLTFSDHFIYLGYFFFRVTPKNNRFWFLVYKSPFFLNFLFGFADALKTTWNYLVNRPPPRSTIFTFLPKKDAEVEYSGIFTAPKDGDIDYRHNKNRHHFKINT